MIKPHPVANFSNVSTYWLPLTLVAGVVAYYFWYLFQYSLNIPYADEIYDVIGFLSEVVKADSGLTVLQLFFVKFNEHSTAASRLIYYLVYRAQGEINFVALTMLGSMSLLLFMGLLYLRVRDLGNRWLILLPVALILFQFRYVYVIFQSMATFAYFNVLVYGFCSIYCLHSVNRLRFFFSFVFAFLATFSLASGQLIWLVGLASLLHQIFISKSITKVYALCWLLVAAAVMLLWHSESVGHPNVHFENLDFSSTAAGKLLEVLSKGLDKPPLELILMQLKYFLALLGSVVSNGSVFLATIAGVISLITLTFVSAISCKGSDIRLELCWVYIVFTVAAISYGRAGVLDIETGLNVHHSIPSTMLLCIVWVLLAARLKLRSGLVLFLAAFLSGVYFIHSYSTYPAKVRSLHDERARHYNEYLFLSIDLREARRIMVESIKLGIYKGPPRPVPLADTIFQSDNNLGSRVRED